MPCPDCQGKFKVQFTGYLTCEQCGTVFSKVSKPNYKCDRDYIEGYFMRLEQSRQRYVEKVVPYLDDVYRDIHKIIDLGGGLPHLALINRMSGTPVFVYDTAADTWEEMFTKYRDDLRIVFHDIAELHYHNSCVFSILPDIATEPASTLISLVHFIEHLQFNQLLQLLEALNRTASKVLIYGPNIESARNDQWVHFKCPGGNLEHITFVTKDFIKKHLNQKECVIEKDIDCDYLLVFK